MSSKEAKIEITAGTARLPAALRSAGKMLEGFVRSAHTSFKPMSKTMLEQPDRRSTAAGSFLGNLGSNLATRGIDVVVGQAKAVYDFEEALVRFGISAQKTPEQMREIGDAARKTSNETGLSAQDVLDAGRAYIDLAGASSFSVAKMNLLARAAQASGASTKDLAGTMYQLTRNMNVPDDQLENTLGGLLNQAKAGGIEAKEMSANFAGILPLYRRFGVVGREGAIQAGAMFQVMRDGANSASEAATMLERVYAGIQSNAPRFEAAHIKIYEDKRDALGRKVLLPFKTIFGNIQGSEAMKDPAALKKLMGRTEGWRGLLLGDEATRTPGSDSDAIAKTVTRLQELEDAGRRDGVILEDLGTVTESTVGKMKIAKAELENKIGEKGVDAMGPAAELSAQASSIGQAILEHLDPSIEKRGKEMGAKYEEDFGFLSLDSKRSELPWLKQRRADLYEEPGGMSTASQIELVGVEKVIADWEGAIKRDMDARPRLPGFGPDLGAPGLDFGARGPSFMGEAPNDPWAGGGKGGGPIGKADFKEFTKAIVQGFDAAIAKYNNARRG